MSSHTTETQGTRQSVLAPRRDKCATSTSVWFALLIIIILLYYYSRFTKTVQWCWGTICSWGSSLGNGALTSGAGERAPAVPTLATGLVQIDKACKRCRLAGVARR